MRCPLCTRCDSVLSREQIEMKAADNGEALRGPKQASRSGAPSLWPQALALLGSIQSTLSWLMVNDGDQTVSQWWSVESLRPTWRLTFSADSRFSRDRMRRHTGAPASSDAVSIDRLLAVSAERHRREQAIPPRLIPAFRSLKGVTLPTSGPALWRRHVVSSIDLETQGGLKSDG